MNRHLHSTRRRFFGTSALSLAPIALNSLFRQQSSAAEIDSLSGPLQARTPHYSARAKSVIFLFQTGGPSQMDLFDPKPALNRRDGEDFPDEFLKKVQFAQIQEKVPQIWGSPYRFSQHGECGAPMSELLPHMATIVDQVSFVHTMKTDDTNHMFAELMMNTGWRQFGRPSIGSWVSYGLGSESQDLPAFLVLGGAPRSKAANYGNGFLPSKYQGTKLRNSGDAILNLSNPAGYTPQRQANSIQTINALNRIRYEENGDDEVAARIASYELAFRMQAAAPELLELNKETPETLRQYGIDDPARPTFARNCLLARRLVERGVRFIQIFNTDWDHHTALATSLPNMCRVTDQPSAALIKDLAQRGLLDDTLVIWGGELGRTPVAQKSMNPNEAVGRDHQINAFTMMFAGGGVKRGSTLGATNDLGCVPITDSWHVYDLQATILHALGLDHKALTYRYQGRDFRLTDVHGNVKHELFA